MNIKEQTSITSGSRVYQFRLIGSDTAATLVITSSDVNEPSSKHVRSIPVSTTAERMSAGVMAGEGYYLFMQDDWGSWCWRETDEQFRGPGKGRSSTDLSGAKLNMLANQSRSTARGRLLGVSNSVGPMLTLHGRHPESGAWASPRFPYALMSDFPFSIADKPEPPHYFEVSNERAVIREMRGTTEYQYVIELNNWLFYDGYVPQLESHGPVLPAAVSTNPADLNNDGRVDTSDLSVLLSAFGGQDAIADINKDGIVDSGDLGILMGGFEK